MMVNFTTANGDITWQDFNVELFICGNVHQTFCWTLTYVWWLSSVSKEMPISLCTAAYIIQIQRCWFSIVPAHSICFHYTLSYQLWTLSLSTLGTQHSFSLLSVLPTFRLKSENQIFQPFQTLFTIFQSTS